MTPRERARLVSVALYGDTGEGFAADVARYGSGFGTVLESPLAFVLAHLVRSDWPLSRMLAESDPAGDCWFIWLAAGNVPEIVRGLADVRVTNLVAFERSTHPRMLRTGKFLSWRAKTTAATPPKSNAKASLNKSERRGFRRTS